MLNKTNHVCSFYRQAVLVMAILLPWSALSEPSARSGWQLQLDNDILAGQATDRDYTGGIGVTLSGDVAVQNPVSIEAFRHWLFSGVHARFSGNGLSGDGSTKYSSSSDSSYSDNSYSDNSYSDNSYSDNSYSVGRSSKPGAAEQAYQAQQFGLLLFTPEDIESGQPVTDDRPYASMLFLSGSLHDINQRQDATLVSRVTLGFLGLDLAADIQSGIHELTGSDTPNGWQYQVSAGGEPALIIELSRMNLLMRQSSQQLKLEAGGRLGSVTELHAGFDWRFGNPGDDWWAFNPYQSLYMQQSSPRSGLYSSSPSSKAESTFLKEWFFYTGARARLVGYNAFLQGQFRSSEVTVASADVERVVAEAWAGFNASLGQLQGRHVLLDVRLQASTPEFDGPNSRSMLWGGIGIGYAW